MQGILSGYTFHGGQQGDLGSRHTQDLGYGDRRVDDIDETRKIGGYVESGIAQDKKLMIGGNLDNRHMAGQSSCVDARFFIERCLEQGGGVDNPLHDEVRLAVPYEADGYGRRLVDVLGGKEFEGGNIQSPSLVGPGGGRRDRLRIPHENRYGDAFGEGGEGGFDNRRFLGGGYGQSGGPGGGGRPDNVIDCLHGRYSLGLRLPERAPKPAWARASSSPSPG